MTQNWNLKEMIIRQVAIRVQYGQLSILMGENENLMKEEVSSSKGDNWAIWRLFVGCFRIIYCWGLHTDKFKGHTTKAEIVVEMQAELPQARCPW